MDDLDAMDRHILVWLQRDGRMTNKALAEHLGLSAPATLERVRKLEESGHIDRYVALVNPALVDRGTTVFVSITLTQHGADAVHCFWGEVEKLPEVLECYHVSGESDFLLKVAVKDISAFEHFMLYHLTKLGNIGQIRSSFVLSTVKYRTELPIDALEVITEPDELVAGRGS